MAGGRVAASNPQGLPGNNLEGNVRLACMGHRDKASARSMEEDVGRTVADEDSSYWAKPSVSILAIQILKL